MSLDPGLRPQPPLAKRLNRNALTVAAVIMGMTVLTAVVVLSPGRKADTGQTGAAGGGFPGAPSQPTFLDAPARGGGRPDTLVSPLPPAATVPPEGRYAVPPVGEPPPGGGTAREQAFEAALRSSVMAGGRGIAPLAGPSTAERGARQSAADSGAERLLALGDSLTRGLTKSAEGAGAHQREFLRRARDTENINVIARLEPAGSPYTIRAGTVVPGVLLTGINSDLPGDIVGQVSRDVYDSRTQRLLLIPRGAKLIGTYDNQIAAGQDRLLVAWTRLIFPDGRSLTLPGLPLTDRAGQAGAADRVNHHYARVFGQALLLSAISAGAQLSQPRQGSILAAPSPGQVAAGAMGQELSNVALEILRRGMDVAPTITIRQGQPFLVFMNGDVVFDGPYEPEP